jgi:hypothetical protein
MNAGYFSEGRHHNFKSFKEQHHKITVFTSHLHIEIVIAKKNQANFLDITISRNPNNVQYGIYRKPTTTDNIIQNTSCHPIEHKMLAISYLIHIMNTYPIRNKH